MPAVTGCGEVCACASPAATSTTAPAGSAIRRGSCSPIPAIAMNETRNPGPVGCSSDSHAPATPMPSRQPTRTGGACTRGASDASQATRAADGQQQDRQLPRPVARQPGQRGADRHHARGYPAGDPQAVAQVPAGRPGAPWVRSLWVTRRTIVGAFLDAAALRIQHGPRRGRRRSCPHGCQAGIGDPGLAVGVCRSANGHRKGAAEARRLRTGHEYPADHHRQGHQDECRRPGP